MRYGSCIFAFFGVLQRGPYYVSWIGCFGCICGILAIKVRLPAQLWWHSTPILHIEAYVIRQQYPTHLPEAIRPRLHFGDNVPVGANRRLSGAMLEFIQRARGATCDASSLASYQGYTIATTVRSLSLRFVVVCT